MPPILDLRKRHLFLSLGTLAALLVVATTPQLLGGQVSEAFHGLLVASPAWLWLAALSFATALAASGCAWHSALRRCGGELGRGTVEPHVALEHDDPVEVAAHRAQLVGHEEDGPGPMDEVDE